MGCDIHFYTERLTTDNDYQGPKDKEEERESYLNEILEGINKTERWVSCDTWELERDWDNEDDENAKSWNVPYKYNYYRGRNYYLFAVLAGVRDSHDEIDTISEPKGIPDDSSTGYKYLVDRWNGDGHSHSYFTLSELLAVDWSKYNEEWLSDFMKTLESMKSIDTNPDKVRAVFFFDN